MKKKIDWLGYLIELVVVFIGITAAFMLNNWRENFKDNQLEQKYLNSLFDDIVYDSQQLKIILAANENKLNQAKRSIEILTTGDLATDSAAGLLASILTNYPFTPETSTYESIKYSGNFNILSDYELKEALILYYQSFEEARFKEQIYNDYIHEYAIPFVYKNMDLLNQTIKTPTAVRGHTFNNLVVGYYALFGQVIEMYQVLVEMNQKLKKRLAEEIE